MDKGLVAVASNKENMHFIAGFIAAGKLESNPHFHMTHS